MSSPRLPAAAQRGTKGRKGAPNRFLRPSPLPNAAHALTNRFLVPDAKQPEKNLYDSLKRSGADITLARQALGLAFGEGVQRKFHAELGYTRPPGHLLEVALEVANLKPDHPQKNRTARTYSVVAAILQELVAYDVIAWDRVEQTFSDHPNLLKLIKSVSDITRVPITLHQPDPDGHIENREHGYNLGQAERAAQMFCQAPYPAQTWALKLAHAAVEARNAIRTREQKGFAAENQARLDYKMHHNRLLYYNAAYTFGFQKFLTMLREGLWSYFDPETSAYVERRIAETEKPEALERAIESIQNRFKDCPRLRSQGLQGAIRIEGRTKTKESTADKMLRDAQEKPGDVKKEALRKLRESYESGLIDLPTYQSGVALASDIHLRTRVPVSRLAPSERETLFNEIRDIHALRLVFPDTGNLKRDGATAGVIEAALKAIPGFKPILPEEGKNYYDTPKPNGYAALHRFYEFEGIVIEIQIVGESVRHEIDVKHPYDHRIYKGLPPDREIVRQGHPSFQVSDAAPLAFARLVDTIERIKEMGRGPLPGLSDSPPPPDSSVVCLGNEKGQSCLVALREGVSLADILGAGDITWSGAGAVLNGNPLNDDETGKLMSRPATPNRQGDIIVLPDLRLSCFKETEANHGAPLPASNPRSSPLPAAQLH